MTDNIFSPSRLTQVSSGVSLRVQASAVPSSGVPWVPWRATGAPEHRAKSLVTGSGFYI